MGMFDRLRCLYPLPAPGANEINYETKSLDCVLDEYEIGADGRLRRQEYDIEDRSDRNAPGLLGIVGMMTRINPRWVDDLRTGEVRFYGGPKGDYSPDTELTWSAYFVDGILRELHQIKRPLPAQSAGGNR